MQLDRASFPQLAQDGAESNTSLLEEGRVGRGDGVLTEDEELVLLMTLRVEKVGGGSEKVC